MAKDIKSIKDKVYELIFQDIIRGEYPVNTIISERMLIEKYQVSKSPIREALVELCKENILNSIPRLGYQVVQITPKELHDVLELRVVVELAAFRKTKAWINDDVINKLEQHINQTIEMIDQHDIIEHWKRNMDFHLLLCSYSNNQWMYNTLESILKFCSRGATQYYFDTWQNRENMGRANAETHIKLLKALKDKDYNLCEQILIKDVSSMKDNFMQSDYGKLGSDI
ncbi:GntR family transcriptional regulator [Vallitalea guaymasensis]|uniref:GntR family transcriptional regulator n=1 Tax=Vallitalea guaymasensis TaxID=1185412 RepID=UPI002354B441|nr:GntR family transcriptional regulator [Vallitalea guaymasensis]